MALFVINMWIKF